MGAWVSHFYCRALSLLSKHSESYLGIGSSSYCAFDALEINIRVDVQYFWSFVHRVAQLFVCHTCNVLRCEIVQCTGYRQALLTSTLHAILVLWMHVQVS